MADPEHLEILQQGVDAWNQRRNNNPDIRPDLSGGAFQGVDSNGINLSVDSV